jgi:peptidoglycan/xylan/chitin deacetylase (PgdA/CDA1 family)
MRRAAVALVLASALAGCGGAGTAPPRPAERTTSRVRVTFSPPAAARAPRPVTAALGPNPLRGAAARHAAVPILAYHVINQAPPGAAYPELWVPPARFAAEIRLLAHAGYRGVTLDRVLAAWRSGDPLPRHPIVVTFDDGYESQVRAGFPVLRRHGWPAVLNIELKNIGSQGVPLVQIRGLAAAGWEIDSHTIHHLDLTTLDATGLHTEIADSRTRLIGLLQRPVDAFCYPAGRTDAAAEAAVRAAGYRAATTEQPGLARPDADHMALPRLRVPASLLPAGLLAELRSLS